jgi:protein-disulfide isomerase
MATLACSGPGASSEDWRDQRIEVEVEVGDAPSRGPVEAPVTVIEFSDFRCPYCRRVQPTLAKLLDRHPDEVRLIFKHFPVVSPDSGRAAVAAVAAVSNEAVANPTSADFMVVSSFMIPPRNFI